MNRLGVLALALASAGASVQASPASQASHWPDRSSQAHTSEAERALLSAREAISQQAWAEAELLLERALMLRPESAEVLIELARLLGQRGRSAEAAAMIRALIEDPRTPQAQSRALGVLLAQIEGPESSAAPLGTGTPQRISISADSSDIRLRLEAMAGYSTNPLVATSASSITITLPDGPFQLPLEGRPIRAGYGALTAGIQTPQGQEFVLQAQQVDLTSQLPAYRAGALLPLSGGTAMLVRTQRFGDGTQRHQIDIQSQHRGAWVLQAGWYQEPSRLRQGLHGRLEWAREAKGPVQVGLWMEGEANRDAGAPGFVGIGARAGFSPWPAWWLTLQGQFQRDTSGYSPLLESNARRSLRTQQVGLEYALGGNPVSPWRIRLYDSRRISNLALFSWIDAGMQLVWRRNW